MYLYIHICRKNTRSCLDIGELKFRAASLGFKMSRQENQRKHRATLKRERSIVRFATDSPKPLTALQCCGKKRTHLDEGRWWG